MDLIESFNHTSNCFYYLVVELTGTSTILYVIQIFMK